MDNGLLMLAAAAVMVFSVLVAAWEYRVKQRGRAYDSETARISEYRKIIALQWATTLLCAVAWVASGRDASDAGLVWGDGLGALVSWGLVVAGLGWLIRDALRLSTNDDVRAQTARRVEQTGDFSAFRFTSRRGFWWMQGVALTAGVCEELLFRILLITALGQLMPVWLAVGLSVVFFGVPHLYQGTIGVVRSAVIGLVFAGLYLWSGSIIPCIIAHIAVDSFGGIVFWLIRDAVPETTPQAVA